MVRYKPRTSVSEMKEHYELKQYFMPAIYETVVKVRGRNMASKFENNYKAIRYEVVEFVRSIAPNMEITGQEAIVLQNELSQLISVCHSTRYRETIRSYVAKVAQLLYDWYSVGKIPTDVCREIYRFLRDHGVPEDIMSTIFGWYGLPT